MVFDDVDSGVFSPKPESEFYAKGGEPKKCRTCGGTSFGQTTKAYVGHVAAEIEYHCEQCSSIVAYWAYGYFDPIYTREEA